MNFYKVDIALQEVPGEISICFSISGCPLRCNGCHSPFLLKKENGVLLTKKKYFELLNRYKNYASCVLFMGGEWEKKELIKRLKQAKKKGYKTCLYTGLRKVDNKILSYLDWVKTGEWITEKGGLDCVETNQKFTEVATGKLWNVLFQKKKNMIRLTEQQIAQKINFINQYLYSENAADGSKVDANANVTSKNIATMEAELNKDINIQVNRALIKSKIETLFGKDLANEYERQIENHEIYVHDETSLKPYCVSISMYPFLLDGLTKLGGESRAPKHLESYCGEFVNLVFAVSSQFAGALATVEFLLYFDHFAAIDYGGNYLDDATGTVKNHLQHVVYAVNQPAAARGYQSVFWNISLYDEYYFNSMFGEFVFPDMQKPSWDRLKKLQTFFMTWFNKERTKAVLTFPVVTAAMLVENGMPKDAEFTQMCAKELSEGNSFFIYQSENADSLASCCRLRNEITDHTFSYSLGAGGVATGSINVITLNMNRLIQHKKDIRKEVKKIHKYQVAYRKLMDEYCEAGLLPVYNSGFISLDKQFLTIGINGMVEAAESLGIKAQDTPNYKAFINNYLKAIFNENKNAKDEWGYLFNTEFVPAENLGVKNAKWDQQDGLEVYRDCYNSYFYAVDDEALNTLDKIMLHGKEYIQYLDGGSALHLNLEETLSKEGFVKLIGATARAGCNYFCFNIKITVCNECNYIDKRTLYSCSSCGSTNIDHATRVIGYLKKVSNFSSDRQKEHALRYYHKEKA